MEYREEYTKFNIFYYEKLNHFFKSAKENTFSQAEILLKECIENDIDFNQIRYKKLIDDYEEVNTNTMKYQLLPMGLVNSNVPFYFVSKEIFPKNPSVSLNVYRNMFLHEAKFAPFFYPK